MFFEKLKLLLKNGVYSLIQSATNESATFLYKIARSKAKIKTIWMGSTKNALLPLTTSFFQKFNLSIRTSYK